MDSAFWDDLAGNLDDSEFLRAYLTESVRISTVDALINALEDARESAHLNKAELARAIGAEPAVVRRLLSATSPNPTIGTLAEVAAALGLRVRLESMPEHERRAVTDALRSGRPTPETRARLAAA
ncbi:helix-turn-helix transcriptional regulator [Catellatospora methionotrophica]|uniref:helix-turn-helix transcriptional regulator n=1 Tax=Catellatospora methionotrophica TaxID=121620 RepID=UPI0034074880